MITQHAERWHRILVRHGLRPEGSRAEDYGADRSVRDRVIVTNDGHALASGADEARKESEA